MTRTYGPGAIRAQERLKELRMKLDQLFMNTPFMDERISAQDKRPSRQLIRQYTRRLNKDQRQQLKVAKRLGKGLRQFGLNCENNIP